MNSWYTSEECQEAMRLYQNGLSLNETAKKYNKTRSVIQYAVKKYNVKSCISFEEGQRRANERRSKGELPMPIYKADVKKNEQQFAFKMMQTGFNYLGGYAPRRTNPLIRLCCQTCGTVIERQLHSIHCKPPICEVCRHNEVMQRRTEKQAEVEKRKQERKALKEEKIKLIGKRLDEVHSCKVCGCDYTIRTYMQSIGTKYERNSGFCSAECRDKRKKELAKEYRKRGTRSNGKHTHRARQYGCEWERGITLRRAVDKLGLTCAICGKPCDWNDHSYGKCGANYPSIDHIKPLSRGGSHTWDNVQIAHILCNSLKETSVDYIYKG